MFNFIFSFNIHSITVTFANKIAVHYPGIKKETWPAEAVSKIVSLPFTLPLSVKAVKNVLKRMTDLSSLCKHMKVFPSHSGKKWCW